MRRCYTQFGRAMHELNIQTICANTSSAKGRVERAHMTLQDRLVKELRLPYSPYDRLQEIDQGAIVDNKRLGRRLDFIKLVQDKRDNNRSQALPAGDGSSRRRRKPTEKKSQRSLGSVWISKIIVL